MADASVSLAVWEPSGPLGSIATASRQQVPCQCRKVASKEDIRYGGANYSRSSTSWKRRFGGHPCANLENERRSERPIIACHPNDLRAYRTRHAWSDGRHRAVTLEGDSLACSPSSAGARSWRRSMGVSAVAGPGSQRARLPRKDLRPPLCRRFAAAIRTGACLARARGRAPRTRGRRSQVRLT